MMHSVSKEPDLGAKIGFLRRPGSYPEFTGFAAGLCKFIDVHRAELIQRVRDGRIIDTHGDLRPEHICLESPPVIIDCLEFNHDLRIMTPR